MDKHAALDTAIREAAEALRTWKAQPEDRDHAARHTAADVYTQAERRAVTALRSAIEAEAAR